MGENQHGNDSTIPVELLTFTDDEASSVHRQVRSQAIAIVAEEKWRRELLAALPRNAPYAFESDAIESAFAIITDGSPAVASAIASIRGRARPEAAILVALEDFTPENVSAAHSAGAFACVRRPVLVEELFGLLASAQESQSAKRRVDALSLQLDLQEHLASIGRISAGLSHALANPLFAASANVQSAQETCTSLTDNPASARLREELVDAGEAIDRVANLLRRFREVGQHEQRSTQNVDLCEIVAGVRERLAQDLARVQVEAVFEPDVPGRGDPVLVAQIVHNLTTNAVRAATSLSSPRVRFHVYAAGPAAIVSVRDNGPGIPDELLETVFEPFYTTHRESGAAGLGLALCREYALRMGARLSLWSAPGRGTCVRLSLSRP